MRQFIKITYILTKKNTGAKNSTVSWRHFLLKDVFSTTISKKKTGARLRKRIERNAQERKLVKLKTYCCNNERAICGR